MQVADISKLFASAKELTDEEYMHIHAKEKRKLVKRNRGLCYYYYYRCESFEMKIFVLYLGSNMVLQTNSHLSTKEKSVWNDESSWGIWGKTYHI